MASSLLVTGLRAFPARVSALLTEKAILLCGSVCAGLGLADGFISFQLSGFVQPTIPSTVRLMCLLSKQVVCILLYHHTFLGLLAQIMCSICS